MNQVRTPRRRLLATLIALGVAYLTMLFVLRAVGQVAVARSLWFVGFAFLFFGLGNLATQTARKVAAWPCVLGGLLMEALACASAIDSKLSWLVLLEIGTIFVSVGLWMMRNIRRNPSRPWIRACGFLLTVGLYLLLIGLLLLLGIPLSNEALVLAIIVVLAATKVVAHVAAKLGWL